MSHKVAQTILLKQFKELSLNPVAGFTVALKADQIFEWEVGIIGPPDSLYSGGYFLCTLSFPSDYPFNPPSFTFNSPFTHPNVYKDGKLCISILHPPGDDPQSGEKAEERWNPTQSPESILISIVSLLSDPNTSSPANVDASVMFRTDQPSYVALVHSQVEMSKRNIPSTVDTSREAYAIKATKQEMTPDADERFWYGDDGSEEEFDFGGSGDEEGDSGADQGEDDD